MNAKCIAGDWECHAYLMGVLSLICWTRSPMTSCWM